MTKKMAKKKEEKLKTDTSKKEDDKLKIDLDEKFVMEFQLIDVQLELISRNMDNLDLKKILLSKNKEKLIENLTGLKEKISKKYKISFDDYGLDLPNKMIIKK